MTTKTMTKIATAKTIRRRIAARILCAQVDVNDIASAVDVARRANVDIHVIKRAGPGGWPVVELRSTDRAAVRRVLNAFGYGDEVTIDVR